MSFPAQNMPSISPTKTHGYVHRYFVTLSDIDQFRHMSFANYVRLMFVSTDSMFLKYLGHGYPEKLRMKLVHSKLQFKRQTVVGDVLDIRIYNGVIKGNLVALNFDFFVEATQERVAQGFQLYECVDSQMGISCKPSSGVLSMMDAIKDGSALSPVEPDSFNDSDWRPNCEIYTYNAFKPFFKHTDFYGAVHPYHFAEWTSYVRESFFSEKCSDFRRVIESEIAMMTTKIDAHIFDDSKFADPIQARLTVTRLKKCSFDVIIRFWNERSKSFVAYTRHTLVFVDPKTQTFTSIPSTIRESIVTYTH